MTTRSPRPTTLAALAGAAAVIASLWLPWYSIDVSKAVDSALGGASGTAPSGPGTELMRGLVAGLLSAVPDRVSATGWLALRGADVALAMLAGAVVLALLVRDLPVRITTRIIALAGVAIVAIVVAHIVDRPGPNAVVTLRPGIWVALAGGVVLAAAGLFGGVPRPAAAPAFRPVPSPLAPLGSPASVPPPGWHEPPVPPHA